MRIDYDRDADAIYVSLTEMPVARTEKVDDLTLVDVDDDGTPVGVEILNARHVWPIDEVLTRYHVDDLNKAQLRAYFHGGGMSVAT